MHKLVNGIEVPLTQKEIEEHEAREKAHAEQLKAYALIQYRDLREMEYPKISDMVVALIEKIGENRSEMFDALMLQRAAIKLKYPKPQS